MFNEHKKICTCHTDNFCLCLNARKKLALPHFKCIDTPDTHETSESKCVQDRAIKNKNNEVFITCFNPNSLLNSKKSKSVVFQKGDKCEIKLQEGFVDDRRSDAFGFKMKYVDAKCENHHNLNFKTISKNFLFPEKINWKALSFKNKNGRFSYFHNFDKNDNFYGLFKDFLVHWVKITENRFKFCYSDNFGKQFFYSGFHFLNFGKKKLVTVHYGDFFGSKSDKIFYCCRFPFYRKMTFGGFNLEFHENLILKEDEPKKCYLCNKKLTNLYSKYYHFYNHFKKSTKVNRFCTNKIYFKNIEKYFCVKFEVFDKSCFSYPLSYKGFPVALIKFSKNNEEIKVINETGFFTLVINNFLLDFGEKSIFLNFKYCKYKISSMGDSQELAFTSTNTFDLLFNIFATKANIDIPYFQPLKKKSKFLEKHQISEKQISQNVPKSPQKSSNLPKKFQISQNLTKSIKMIPVKQLQNIGVMPIPSIEGIYIDNVNTCLIQTTASNDLRNQLYFPNKNGIIKLNFKQLSLLNKKEKNRYLDLKFEERMAKISQNCLRKKRKQT